LSVATGRKGPCRADLVPAATIPVERIRGAVLLISTEDDQGYGVAFHDVAAQRLAAHDHPYAWRHVVYERAGHNIAKPPYAPTTRSLSPGPGVTFRAGGTPADDAHARAAAWRETMRFLAEELVV
jgi:dienelactone hydrolase